MLDQMMLPHKLSINFIQISKTTFIQIPLIWYSHEVGWWFSYILWKKMTILSKLRQSEKRTTEDISLQSLLTTFFQEVLVYTYYKNLPSSNHCWYFLCAKQVHSRNLQSGNYKLKVSIVKNHSYDWIFKLSNRHTKEGHINSEA